jgi:hypothetical protein
MDAVAIAGWIALPVVVAGLIHVAVIKLQLFPALAKIPLDGGLTFRNRTWFGANKTLRGVLTMIAATSGLVWLQVHWSAAHDSLWSLTPDFERLHPALWGALAGAGYIAGELPNSFLKRQLGIGPGETSTGRARPVFWIVDQIDSMIGVVLFLIPVWRPTAAETAALLGLTLIVHPAVAALMYALGLKRRIG